MPAYLLLGTRGIVAESRWTVRGWKGVRGSPDEWAGHRLGDELS